MNISETMAGLENRARVLQKLIRDEQAVLKNSKGISGRTGIRMKWVAWSFALGSAIAALSYMGDRLALSIGMAVLSLALCVGGAVLGQMAERNSNVMSARRDVIRQAATLLKSMQQAHQQLRVKREEAKEAQAASADSPGSFKLLDD